MLITITGQTPSQKNSKEIVYNRRTNRPFIMSNKRVKAWQNDALIQLLEVKETFTEPVKISYKFYVKDNRKRDIDNMICSVNDVLQEGIISGDHWQVLEIGSAAAEIDRENPRVEIEINPLDKH